MGKNNNKAGLIAECVGDCRRQNPSREAQISCLSGLLWAIAKGTRWEIDAKIGIEGVCPGFFKEGITPKTDDMQLPKRQTKNKNLRTQFELCTWDYDYSIIREAYEWCLKNLPLKDECGIKYMVNELFIVTSSQKILDKLNTRFGSNFSFNNRSINSIQFFITAKKTP